MKNLAPDLRPGYLDRRGLAVSISHNETELVVLIQINVPSTGSRFHLWLALAYPNSQVEDREPNSSSAYLGTLIRKHYFPYQCSGIDILL